MEKRGRRVTGVAVRFKLIRGRVSTFPCWLWFARGNVTHVSYYFSNSRQGYTRLQKYLSLLDMSTIFSIESSSACREIFLLRGRKGEQFRWTMSIAPRFNYILSRHSSFLHLSVTLSVPIPLHSSIKRRRKKRENHREESSFHPSLSHCTTVSASLQGYNDFVFPARI